MPLNLYVRTLAVVGSILAVLLVLTLAWTVHDERKHLEEQMRDQLARVTDLQAVAVARSMWDLNRESTQVILDGLRQHPKFNSARLYTSSGKLFAVVGDPDAAAENVIIKRQSVVFDDGVTETELGILEIAFSVPIHGTHFDEHLWHVLGLGVLLMAAALLLLVVSLRHLLKPIESITGSLLALADGDLKTSVPGTGRTDQIGKMARAVARFRDIMVEIEDLRQEDAAKAAELADARDRLEERVQERTEELLSSKTRLARAQRIAKLGSWTLDVESEKVHWSDNQYRLFGYEPQAFTPSLGFIIGSIVPEERDQFLLTVQNKLASKETGYSHEYRIVRKDGEERILHSTVEIERDENGEACKLSGVYRDVTEQRQVEEAKLAAEIRFRALIDNSPSAIFLKDTDGNSLLANKQWHTWFNTENKEITGRPVLDFCPPDIADRMVESDKEIIETGKPMSLEFRTPLPDGQIRTIMLQKFPVIDDKGAVVAIGSFNTDISDLKRALEEANRASISKTEFLSNMSHELRTPLNGILGFSEMMKLETLGPLNSETYGEYVGLIHDAGAHLLDIISQILDVSRIESGSEELSESKVSVQEAMAFSLKNLEQRYIEYDLRVIVDIADDLPDLWVDRTRFEQILTNLTSNAIKYNKPGGWVNVKAGIDEAGCMLIKVKDSGIGIEGLDLNRVQDRFERAQSSSVQKTDGIGLGLPIVRLLCKLHQAEFHLESVVNEGTTATVVFPKTRVVSSASEERLAM